MDWFGVGTVPPAPPLTHVAAQQTQVWQGQLPQTGPLDQQSLLQLLQLQPPQQQHQQLQVEQQPLQHQQILPQQFLNFPPPVQHLQQQPPNLFQQAQQQNLHLEQQQLQQQQHQQLQRQLEQQLQQLLPVPHASVGQTAGWPHTLSVPADVTACPVPSPSPAVSSVSQPSGTVPEEVPSETPKCRSASRDRRRSSSRDRRRSSSRDRRRSPSRHRRRSCSRGRRRSRSRGRRSRSRDRRKSRSRDRKRSRSRDRRSRSRDRRRSSSRSNKHSCGLDASTLSESIARAAAAAKQAKEEQARAAEAESRKLSVDWSRIQRSQFRRDFLGMYASPNPAEAAERRAALNITIEADTNAPGLTPAPLQSFADLQILPSWISRALQENRWDAPMPIQAQAFPILLAGRNLIGIAQTGSGKTIAFLLPAVIHANAQQPLRRSDPGPIVLVLAPTRELAVQISDEADKLIKYSGESPEHPGGMRSVCFYGGGKKRDQLMKFTFDGSHIVAATPGRLLDFCAEGKVSLQRVTYLCLDEADRMLELGFLGDMEQIGGAIRPERQMAFFSATWPKEVQSLAMGLCLDSPVTFRVGRAGSNSGSAGNADDGEVLVANKSITQEVVVIDFPNEPQPWEKQDQEKRRILFAHIRSALADWEAKMLIFVNQKNFADELSNALWEEGFMSDSLHGGRPQEKRLYILDQFRKGDIRVLIATDVMGRGLDIPCVSHVVIYSMNGVPDYIHRIGRTGRGKDGKGHALVFFEYMPKQADTAKELLAVLVAAEQVVPPQLQLIAAQVEAGQRYNPYKDWNDSNWKSSGWKSGGSWKKNGS